jgi:hypothetical protein
VAESTVDRAGVANEAGSVHRRNVAVFLAVHGLTGRAVLGGIPTFLAFETAHATDDILCELDTGRRLFISAKRTCGVGKPFQDTVADWVKTAFEAGDRLVLATAEPKSSVRFLGPALERRREAPGTVAPKGEAAALDDLMEQLADETEATRDRMIDAAAVLVVNDHHKLMCAVLEGTVVQPGQGPATVSHLESLFHTQAGSAYSGDLDSWRTRLVSLGVPLLEGPDGSSHAQWIALAKHREALASRLGRVDLSLLADDLEPLVIPDLVMGIRVTTDTGDPDDPTDTSRLDLLARRVPRLLVEGLPGSGKSAALVQLAALWAREPDAPLPILVRLKELAGRCAEASDVTADLLCDLAAGGRADLAAGFRAALARGHAVLLLDGLDECLDKAALIAQGVKQTVSGLPAQTGVVLTTRPGSAAATRRLGLLNALLTTPSDLDTVLTRLLEHVAATRAPDDPAGWVADRSDRLRTVRSDLRDVGEVPLLSILVALTIADDRRADLPTTTAGVLTSAIEQTITRWEDRKDSLPAGYAVRPTKDQLLTAFAAIGRLLARQPITAPGQVRDTVIDALVRHWALPRADATERASAAMWFWDDRNGVFVTDTHGNLTARSRVFAEIGAAQWCPHLDEPELRDWVDTAVEDQPQHAALLLAAQTDHRVVPLLLDHPQIATQALHNGARFTDEQRGVLLDRLLHPVTPATADAEGSVTTASPSKSVIRLIAGLPLSGALNVRRVEALMSFDMSHDDRTCSLATAAMAAATTERRRLTPSEVDTVMAMLSLPLPTDAPRPPTGGGVRRFGGRAPLPRERGAAVVQASKRVGQLPEAAAGLFARLTPRMSTGEASKTAANLSRQGHMTGLEDSFGKVLTTLDGVHGQVLDDFRTLLGIIGGLSSAAVSLGARQRWRLDSLNRLLQALRFHTTEPVDLFTIATARAHDLTGTWLRTVALAAGLDPDILAAEARSCLPDAVQDVLDLVCVCFPCEDDMLSLERLDEDARAQLPALLVGDVDWMADTATEILWGHVDLAWFQVVTALIPHASPSRRYGLACLAISLSGDTADQAAAYFASSDPPMRWAAATWFGDTDPLREQALPPRAGHPVGRWSRVPADGKLR